MRIAQLSLDVGLRVRQRGPKGLGLAFVADHVRRALAATLDPPVQYEIGGCTIEIPLSHPLPFLRLAHPEYGANLGRLAGRVAAKYSHGTVVDIGANVGDTVAIVRGACSLSILAIEGADAYLPLLERNARRLGDVQVVRAIVGERARSMPGALVPARGSGRVEPGPGIVETVSLADVIADQPGLPPVRLVKVDTDGQDCAILEGALPFLARARPVLFFEYDPAWLTPSFDSGRFFGRLAEAGYRSAVVFDNVGRLLMSRDARDAPAFQELQRYLSGRQHLVYADIALFAEGDAELAEATRAAELANDGPY